jgi:O-Antigen ligase
MSSKFTYIVIIPLSVLLMSFLGVFISWYLVFLFLLCLIVFVPMIARFENGLLLLIFLVPVAITSTGFYVQSSWNFKVGYTHIDQIAIAVPFAFIALCSYAMSKMARINSSISTGPLMIPIMGLFFYAAITILWAPIWEHSLFQLFVLATNIVIYGVTITTITNENIHRKVMWFYIISALCQGLVALSLYFPEPLSSNFDWQISDNTAARMHLLTGAITVFGKIKRATAFTMSHEVGLFMNTALAVATGLLFTEKEKSKKTVLVVMICFFISVTMLTMSRAAFGSLIIMAFLILFLMRSLRRYIVVLFPLFVVGAISLYIAEHYMMVALFSDKYISPRFTQGWSGTSSGAPQFAAPRLLLWKKGFAQFWETYGLGVGVGNYKYFARAPHAHSIYFSYIFDFGLVGLAFLSAIALEIGRRALRVLKFQSSYLQIMSVTIVCGLSGAGIHCLVDFEYNRPFMWLYLGIVITTLLLALKEIKLQDLNHRG